MFTRVIQSHPPFSRLAWKPCLAIPWPTPSPPRPGTLGLRLLQIQPAPLAGPRLTTPGLRSPPRLRPAQRSTGRVLQDCARLATQAGSALDRAGRSRASRSPASGPRGLARHRPRPGTQAGSRLTTPGLRFASRLRPAQRSTGRVRRRAARVRALDQSGSAQVSGIRAARPGSPQATAPERWQALASRLRDCARLATQAGSERTPAGRGPLACELSTKAQCRSPASGPLDLARSTWLATATAPGVVRREPDDSGD